MPNRMLSLCSFGTDGHVFGYWCTKPCSFADVDAIAAIAVEFLREVTQRAPVSSILKQGDILIMVVGENHPLLGLDLFVAFEWSDLNPRTLQGWQVLHLPFESATFICGTCMVGRCHLIFKSAQ